MAKQDAKAVTPRLRFPEFRDRDGWDGVPLGDASTPVSQRVGERKLTPVSISAGIGFVPQAEKFGRDISGNQYALYTLVRDGDFVYNKGNSLKFPQGCVYQLRGWGEVAAPNVFISFRLKQGFVAEFFQYCFERNIHGTQLQRHITSGARSNGLLNVSKDQFFGVEIPTPQRGEQQKIADCLTSLDEVIAAQGRKVEALKAHKRGLMQQLFPREGETRPRLRFPEFRDAPEWEQHRLGDIASISKGKGISKADIAAEGRTPCIRYGELYTVYGEVIDRPLSRTDVPAAELVLSQAGDVLVPASGETKEDIATSAVVLGAGVALGGDLNIIRLDADGRFFSYYLNGAKRRALAKVAQGDTVVHLYPRQLEQLDVAIPVDKAEQQRIADCLSSLDSRITAESRQLAALKTHKQGLMQQLFPVASEVA